MTSTRTTWPLGSGPDDDDADDMQPPTRRQRTTMGATTSQPELTLEETAELMERGALLEPGDDDDELSMAPTSPADTPAEHPEFPGQARHDALPGPADPALLAPPEVPLPGNSSDIINIDEPEPSREPSIHGNSPATPANANGT